MSRLKIATSSQMCKLLESEGFFAARQRGSHRIYLHADGRRTVIPMHSKDLDKKLIFKILKVDVKMSIDEYNSNV